MPAFCYKVPAACAAIPKKFSYMEFNSVQIGLDIATSMAILASAITFLVNQKRKSDQA